MTDQIIQFCTNLAPALIALAGVITAIAKGVASVKSTANATINEIKSSANVKALVEENQQLRAENAEIIQSVKELTIEVTKLKKSITKGR